MALATRDFPLYVTVMAGHYNGASESERTCIFKALKCDPEFMETCEVFYNLTANFTTLYLRTDGTIVVTAEMPDLIREHFSELIDIYEHYQLTPLVRDRLEGVVGRMTRVPENQWHRDQLVHGLDYFLGEREVGKGLKLTTSNETINGSLYEFLA